MQLVSLLVTASNLRIEVNAPNGFAQDVSVTTSAVPLTGTFDPISSIGNSVAFGHKIYTVGGRDNSY
jgi:hypothetical protein